MAEKYVHLEACRLVDLPVSLAYILGHLYNSDIILASAASLSYLPYKCNI